jgi:hypothetical protein
LSMEPKIEDDKQLSIAERDLAVLERADLEKYDIDPRTVQDPFTTYGEEVLKGENFFDNDIGFALLDIAWRVRKEDEEGKTELREKVVKMIEKKGKRLGFIFAYTLLNSCHAVEDDDQIKPAEEKYKLTDGLQKFAVNLIGDYLDSIESVEEGDTLKQGDIEALKRTVERSVLNIDFWKDVAEMRESKVLAGDGYLEVDNSIELLKRTAEFAKAKMEGSNLLLTMGGNLKKLGQLEIPA